MCAKAERKMLVKLTPVLLYEAYLPNAVLISVNYILSHFQVYHIANKNSVFTEKNNAIKT
jgi:hypothetical protein